MNFWNNPEYAPLKVLLIAIVVAIITLFRNQIKSAIAGKIGDVQGSISGFNADQ